MKYALANLKTDESGELVVDLPDELVAQRITTVITKKPFGIYEVDGFYRLQDPETLADKILLSESLEFLLAAAVNYLPALVIATSNSLSETYEREDEVTDIQSYFLNRLSYHLEDQLEKQSSYFLFLSQSTCL